MKKILLLNCPGTQRYSRDYYCGHILKEKYCWPPIDLLVISGILAHVGQVKVIDAIATNKNYQSTLKNILNFAPDLIVCVTASVSWKADMDFLAQIKQNHSCSIFLTGDYPRSFPQKIIELYHNIDGIILDFTDNHINDFLLKNKDTNLKNIYTKWDQSKPEIITDKEFSYNIPQHNLFPLKKYRLPQIKFHPFASILTDYSCPYNCYFCFFERIKYKRRNIENIRKELNYLERIGIKEVFLADASFGANRSYAFQVCQLLAEYHKPFSWVCEMKVSDAHPQLLEAMRDSGCHTIMFGVETNNQKILDQFNKSITVAQTENAFHLAKKYKFKTLAHFILGLPGETYKSQVNLIKFSKKLNPNIASFNMANPVYNTTFRDNVESEYGIINKEIEVDTSISLPIWESDKLSRKQVFRLRNKAMVDFYLRPKFIIDQFLAIRSSYQLRVFLFGGASLMLTILKNFWKQFPSFFERLKINSRNRLSQSS